MANKQCNPNEKPITITWADLLNPADKKYASDNIKTRQPVDWDKEQAPFDQEKDKDKEAQRIANLYPGK